MDPTAAEKMVALKKAYADIMLNTARESAARIMDSERKAMTLQRSLVDTKEQALSTVVRVKSIMDAKIQEVEKTSLDQERRIQELEAQLSKAHDTIGQLTDELKRVNNEIVMESECPKELEQADARCLVVNHINGDGKFPVNDSKLTTSEEAEDTSHVRNNGPLKRYDTKHEAPCESNGTLDQAGNNKFLKYTFQRTRKRGSCSRKNENDTADNQVTKKRKLENEHKVIVEPRNPSLVTELPRDNRRLVQVARQLISLSEKRW